VGDVEKCGRSDSVRAVRFVNIPAKFYRHEHMDVTVVTARK
jgi:hypothetical protein